VPSGGAAAKAGIEPGDVIVEYNGRPVANSDELVKAVVATKPGSTVPVKILRNKQEKTVNVTVEELDLDAEQNAGRRPSNNDREQPQEQQSTGSFGLTLDNLTPQMARRLRVPSGQSGAVISDIDSDGPSAGLLRPGDVILSVNGKSVANAADAARALGAIQAGHLAQLRVWRAESEIFVPVKKE
jgi:serine protease Do